MDLPTGRAHPHAVRPGDRADGRRIRTAAEIVLLFKAKHAQEKDDADFAAVLPRLEPERRRWLADALELVHPGHRWLERLTDR